MPPCIMMAIETAGSACSVALARDGAVLAAARRPLRHGHAEALFPLIECVTSQAAVQPARLDTIAVATGPGGFTGIRAGLAAAHGIALALRARLVGVPCFAACSVLKIGVEPSLRIFLPNLYLYKMWVRTGVARSAKLNEIAVRIRTLSSW